MGRPTVRAALRILEGEEWIEAAQGKRRRILRPVAPQRKRSGSGVVGALGTQQPHTLSPFILYVINALQSPLHEAGHRLQICAHPTSCELENPSCATATDGYDG